MNASIVKTEQVGKQQKPKKPMVVLQVLESRIGYTSDDAKQVYHYDHLHRLMMRSSCLGLSIDVPV
jgi:hypothetical protein